MNDSVYAALAPCYAENMIESYGPVPVFTKDHRVVSRGIPAGYSVEERDALYSDLHNLYESTRTSFKSRYAYPGGPVISFGYDAAGSVSIGIYEKFTVDRQTFDEMYAFIAGEAKKQGIQNVPVVIHSEPMPGLDAGTADVRRPVIRTVPGRTIPDSTGPGSDDGKVSFSDCAGSMISPTCDPGESVRVFPQGNA